MALARGRHDVPPALVVARGERVALSGVALAVGLVWIIDIGLRGYVYDMSATVSWWRFAVAPAVAAAGLCVWALTRRTREPRRVVGAASVTRRTWMTFGPRRGIPLFFVLVALTSVIMVVLGRMSTTFDPGLSAHIALSVPNTEMPPVVTVFPGWAYGIPSLLSLLVLAAAVALALRRNAVRPFPADVPLDAERVRRGAVARDVIGIAIAATLVSLAGLLRMARASVVSTTSVMTNSGRDAVVDVHLPHADLILGGGLVAPAVEIAGCVLLALLVVRGIRLARIGRAHATSATGAIA